MYGWSYLATGTAIDVCLYGTARITFHPNTQLCQLSVCQIECPHGYPSRNQLVVSPLEHEGTIKVMNYRRYFLPLSGEDSTVARSEGLYLLKNSNITVRVDNVDNDTVLKLYLFNDISSCDDFFGGKSLDKLQYVNWYAFTNSSHEYFYSVEQDSFYCALWEVESQTLNFTFNYTTSVFVVSFDISSYQSNGFCSQCSKGTVELKSNGIGCNQQRKICLILSLYDPMKMGADIGVVVYPLEFRSNYVVLWFICGLVISVLVSLCLCGSCLLCIKRCCKSMFV